MGRLEFPNVDRKFERSLPLGQASAGDTSLGRSEGPGFGAERGCSDGGWAPSPAVQHALREVPRHRYTPESPLRIAYDDDRSPVTRRDDAGRATSSVSAPWLQAGMLESLRLKPGMTVLEVGSGGYNAELIAHVVAPDGRVVSVDIDGWVVERTRRFTGFTLCGFVRDLGAAARPTPTVDLADGQLQLRFEDGPVPASAGADDALVAPRCEVPTGVTVAGQESFETLPLYLATTLPGFCRLAGTTGSRFAELPRGSDAAALVRDGSFAYLTHIRVHTGRRRCRRSTGREHAGRREARG
ncbi:hypothetical protein [Streptomyces sp. B93]|uniref:hypothetical protein n=1 Tax=Streptomyces sp. B93 TaxID=2824875 RepID=UPI001B363E1F|nr:hypothetical protein [Streptomyces sp. B93]